TALGRNVFRRLIRHDFVPPRHLVLAFLATAVICIELHEQRSKWRYQHIADNKPPAHYRQQSVRRRRCAAELRKNISTDAGQKGAT
ncbi:MAG: hypothetical protein P4L86_13785, partial [Mycobacterium sp.]|nr:hypothetical protein [Mycobacterium sp.]